MTSRAIPVEPEVLGCINESGAFDPRGSRVLIRFEDERDPEAPRRATVFAITRAAAERLGRKLLEST